MVDDFEFMALWKEHGSATKMANVLDVSVRTVHIRRRRIEGKYEIQLGGADVRSAAYYPHISEREHPAKHPVEIQNGTIVVFSDAHFWPGVRTTAFRALLNIGARLKPTMVINNGDAFDGASISRYPRIGWDHKPSVIEELKSCKERLGEIEEIVPGTKIWTLGNHDARFETFLAANAPQFEKVHGFKLKDHMPAWTPCWSAWVNNDCVIKHRWKGGIHAVHNNAVNSGRTMVTGHLHSLKVTPFTDYNGTRFGVDTGTLAEPQGPQFEDYLETSPTNWRSGFAVLTYHKGRLLWPEVVNVLDFDRVEFRGEVIDVSKD
jgi:hypothetical protein